MLRGFDGRRRRWRHLHVDSKNCEQGRDRHRLTAVPFRAADSPSGNGPNGHQNDDEYYYGEHESKSGEFANLGRLVEPTPIKGDSRK